jgi:hypothetical protein
MRMAAIDTLERPAALLRGRSLEYFTIAWNTLEGLVALVTGIIAGSISLVGFGIDGFIEVTSGSVLLWRMSVDSDANRRERNEKCAPNCWSMLSLARRLCCLRLDLGLVVEASPSIAFRFT